jgi:predicted nucleic acid-binding protein
MILLDTSIISEGLRPRPDANVRKWLDAQRPEDLFLCTPVLAEMRYGVELLPAGARRSHIDLALKKAEEAFADRILVLDRVAAYEYGRIVAQRDRMGRATGTTDGLIAAIAKAHGATIATRDFSGFNDVGIDVTNPFEFSNSSNTK